MTLEKIKNTFIETILSFMKLSTMIMFQLQNLTNQTIMMHPKYNCMIFLVLNKISVLQNALQHTK